MSLTNGTTITVKKPKNTPQPEQAEIYEFEKSVVSLTLEGSSQLIVNNFDSKGIQQMEDERRLSAEEKREKKRQPKAPVVPEEKWQAARILDADGYDCFPARYIKAALGSIG